MGLKEKIDYVLNDPACAVSVLFNKMRLGWLGVEHGSHLRLEGRVDIPCPRGVRLGHHVSLGRDVRLGGFPEGRVAIGDHSYIGRYSIILSRQSVEIGSDVIIAPYAYITDVSHGIARGELIRLQTYESRPVQIGSDVWFGVGVTVLPGVQIGEGAVIGARAVVTHDIPSGAVAVGVPARVIRYR